jgi:hypothetical protein
MNMMLTEVIFRMDQLRYIHEGADGLLTDLGPILTKCGVRSPCPDLTFALNDALNEVASFSVVGTLFFLLHLS